VVIIANLKPRNMRGIKSNGMVLCASNEEHSVVEPLAPPEGAAVGERVWFGDVTEQDEPAKPNQVGIGCIKAVCGCSCPKKGLNTHLPVF
jgi:tRNA-binding EMAP/Myf-like protein